MLTQNSFAGPIMRIAMAQLQHGKANKKCIIQTCRLLEATALSFGRPNNARIEFWVDFSSYYLDTVVNG